MTNKELLQKREAALDEAQAVLTTAGIKTAEKREKYEKIMADVADYDFQLDSARAVEEARAMRKKVAVDQFRPDPSQSNDPEERAEVRRKEDRNSLINWMKTGRASRSMLPAEGLSNEEKRALASNPEYRDLTETGTSSVTLPVSFESNIVEAKKSWGQLYNLVTIVKTPHSEPRKFVLANDTSNGWANVSVGTDISETDPTLSSSLTINMDVISTERINVGIDLLNDSGFDVEGWIYQELGRRYARGAANAILVGGGPNDYVAGILPTITSGNVQATNSGNVVYADIVKLLTTLDPAYQENAVFAMNNNTIFNLAGLTDNNGRPLWIPNFGAINQSVGEYQGTWGTQFFGSLLGHPVKIVTQMSNAGAGNTPIFFGDFQEGYKYRETTQGLMLARLNERYLPSYEIGFLGFAKVGGAVTDAGTHPIVGLYH